MKPPGKKKIQLILLMSIFMEWTSMAKPALSFKEKNLFTSQVEEWINPEKAKAALLQSSELSR